MARGSGSPDYGRGAGRPEAAPGEEDAALEPPVARAAREGGDVQAEPGRGAEQPLGAAPRLRDDDGRDGVLAERPIEAGEGRSQRRVERSAGGREVDDDEGEGAARG